MGLWYSFSESLRLSAFWGPLGCSPSDRNVGLLQSPPNCLCVHAVLSTPADSQEFVAERSNGESSNPWAVRALSRQTVLIDPAWARRDRLPQGLMTTPYPRAGGKLNRRTVVARVIHPGSGRLRSVIHHSVLQMFVFCGSNLTCKLVIQQVVTVPVPKCKNANGIYRWRMVGRPKHGLNQRKEDL